MSVMVVLLESVRWDIGHKKGPENEGLVRSLHAFSGRVRSTQSLRGGWAAHSRFDAGISHDVHHGHHYGSVPSPYQVGPEKYTLFLPASAAGYRWAPVSYQLATME